MAGHRHCLPAHYACQLPLNKIVLILRRACGVIFEWEGAEEHRHQRTGAGQYIIFGAQALTATKIASFRTSASGVSGGATACAHG